MDKTLSISTQDYCDALECLSQLVKHEQLTPSTFIAAKNDPVQFVKNCQELYRDIVLRSDIDKEIIRLYMEGGTIVRPVKFYRDMTGAGLKNAKEYVDKVLESHQG